jgi:hypothetical protein
VAVGTLVVAGCVHHQETERGPHVVERLGVSAMGRNEVTRV